jgi:hypothetical protein
MTLMNLFHFTVYGQLMRNLFSSIEASLLLRQGFSNCEHRTRNVTKMQLLFSSRGAGPEAAFLASSR